MTRELFCDCAIGVLVVMVLALLAYVVWPYLSKLARILLALAGFFGCLQHCAGPARASTTESALEVLCPGHQDLATHVDAAARKHMLHPVALVAVMRVESRCRMDAVGKAGEVCAFQLRGVARNGRTRVELRDPATCIDTGARWLSLMTTWSGSLPGGLGAYNTGKRGKGQRYARKVLGFVARVWQVIDSAAMRERQS